MLQNPTNNYYTAIKTAWGSTWGMGHLQRMLSLLWYFNNIKKNNTFLISGTIPEFFPVDLKKYIKPEINSDCNLIIRDMRDSSIGEIAALRKSAKVIVIDDKGPGSEIADTVIEILPDANARVSSNDNNSCKPLIQIRKNNKAFIYGYNFLKSVSELKNNAIKKNIDFAIYPGNSAGSEYINFLKSLLPDDSNFAVLNGKESYLINKGTRTAMDHLSYAEIIMSARVIISHFGITLYEGAISGCRLISINPTEYHSKLSETAKTFLPLINLGEYNSIDKTAARISIRRAVETPFCESVDSADVYKKIITGLEYFYNLLRCRRSQCGG